VTDHADNVTKFTYDAQGDLISMIDPNGGATSFAYFAVPEPSTWAAMLLGFAGLAFAGRRRARKTSLVKAKFAEASRQSSLPAIAALSLSAASSALRQCGAISRTRS
jgi:YD repeat-containing protein